VNQLCGPGSAKDYFGNLDRQLGLTCRGRLSRSPGGEYSRLSACLDRSLISELERLFRGIRIKLDGMA